MTTAVRIMTSANFDQSPRRLLWIVPIAFLIWSVILLAFGYLLRQTTPPPPILSPVEARIVELPPVAGLQGGAAAAAPAAPHVVPKPRPHPIPHPHVHVMKPRVMPPAPSINGTAKKTAEAPAPPASSSTAGKTTSTTATGISGGKGVGSGAGVGSDSGGARAIYAPKPETPDDMREDSFQAVAMAHFKVAADGQVEVALVKPTQSPRLNEILLETLKQWRFFPAMRSGVAVDSEFDVRIPISIQ